MTSKRSRERRNEAGLKSKRMKETVTSKHLLRKTSSKHCRQGDNLCRVEAGAVTTSASCRSSIQNPTKLNNNLPKSQNQFSLRSLKL